MDESRKQFEAWFCKRSGEDINSVSFLRSGDSYWDDAHCKTKGIQKVWEAWTASRAGIEIKAPRFIGGREAIAKGYTVDYSNGFGDGMDAYEEAIRAAGIKVKE